MTDRELIQQLRGMTNRELFQQLRDELHVSLKLLEGNSYPMLPQAVALIAAADARLAQPEWTRVEDAVPVIPDNKVSVDVWFWFAGKEPYRWPFSRYADMLDSRVTHWQYVVEPQPPEQQP